MNAFYSMSGGQMMDLDYWIKSETYVCLKLAPSASD